MIDKGFRPTLLKLMATHFSAFVFLWVGWRDTAIIWEIATLIIIVSRLWDLSQKEEAPSSGGKDAPAEGHKAK
jgi:hypothetical protein